MRNVRGREEPSVRTRREVSLAGPRVMLRPLEVGDFEAWREIRLRSRDWLETWEPLPELGSPDPVADRDAFRARCGAGAAAVRQRVRIRAAAARWHAPRRGELGKRARTVPVEISSGTGSTRSTPATDTSRKVSRCDSRGFDTLGLHRMEAAIVRNEKSRRAARSRYATRAPLDSSSDPRRVGRPRALRDHDRSWNLRKGRPRARVCLIRCSLRAGYPARGR